MKIEEIENGIKVTIPKKRKLYIRGFKAKLN